MRMLQKQTKSDEDVQALAPSMYAAQVLEKWILPKAKVDLTEISKQRGISRRTLETHLASAAQVAFQNQACLRDSVLAWVADMAKAKVLEPIMFIDHSMYDETPMMLRVAWKGQKQLGRNKVLVIKSSWVILVKFLHEIALDAEKEPAEPTPEYMCLQGQLSPALRPVECTTGEGLVSAILTLPQPPSSTDVFQTRVRVAEIDDYKANARCEGILSANRLKTSSWSALTIHCCGHKAHAAAEKTWMLPRYAPLVSSTLNFALFLQVAAVFEEIA